MELVDRVLDEYGDPVEESESAGETFGQASESSNADPLAPESIGEEITPTDQEGLSAKQRETLHQINGKSKATQQEIGDALDVTAATIPI